MYQQSVFCWEEVIVAQPQMHFHHRRIAEVYYTMGTEVQPGRYCSPRRLRMPCKLRNEVIYACR